MLNPSLPNLRRAERILSLFTDAPLAENIVGDLAEAERNLPRFWRSVALTVIALFLQQVRRNPRRLSITIAGGLILAQVVISGIIPMTTLSRFGISVGRAESLALFAINMFIVCLIGFVAARVNPGREMTVCVCLSIATMLVSTFGIGLFASGRGSALAAHFSQYNLIASVLLTSCGVVARFRSTKAAGGLDVGQPRF